MTEEDPNRAALPAIAPAECDQLGTPSIVRDLGPSAPETMTVAAFLDHVALLLRTGLPRQIWLEATVVSVRAGRFGYTLEVADPAVGQGASLRAFLPTATLLAVKSEIGAAFDPTLLAGMTTVAQVQPEFHPRWHLGARIVALARVTTASLLQRLVEQAVVVLKREGLWDRQRRLPAPRDVTRISVVHPAGAAGWADVAARLAPWQAAGLLLVRSVAVPFEGERAALGLVRALVDAAGRGDDGHTPDLLLLVRGGGARQGLAALDDEAVARAICTCQVPLVAGTGHATDVTLADGCAWRRVDTPTAAAALVISLIAAAARAAVTDHAAIITAAIEIVAHHDRQLVTMGDRLQADLDRVLAATAQALQARWSTVRVAAETGRGRLDRQCDSVSALLREIMAKVPALLADAEERARRAARDVADHAWRLVRRRDDGAAVLAGIGARARALVAREAGVLVRVKEAARRDAARAVADAEAALSRAALLVEAHDLGTILRRGFVLVTDAAGRVLTTRASAANEPHIVLTFGDGPIAAVPGELKRGDSGGAGWRGGEAPPDDKRRRK